MLFTKDMREFNQKKVEALREKWAASILMLGEEYAGARERLLSAQCLYPELEDISLMLIVCDILLLAATTRLSCNEIVSYCILDLIIPSPTYSDARYHYQNLVTSMHSIKHQFPGTELALEIVQNAFTILSDLANIQELE